MRAMASQITSLTSVCSIVYSGADQNIKAPRHWPLWGEFTGDRWIPRTKGQWRGKCFHLMTSSCFSLYRWRSAHHTSLWHGKWVPNRHELQWLQSDPYRPSIFWNYREPNMPASTQLRCLWFRRDRETSTELQRVANLYLAGKLYTRELSRALGWQLFCFCFIWLCAR